MIPSGEIIAGVTGALRLVRRDPSGMAYFNATPQGFWNSFWAAALVAPAFLILDLLTGGLAEMAEPRRAMIQFIGYVIDWTAFPVMMITVVDSLGKWPQYIRYIVAYNWSAVVQMAVLLPIALLAITVPSHATLILAQAATIILLVYRAYVAHVALQVGFGTAAGVVLLDVLLAGLLKAVTDRLLGIVA